jgi:hypothetical protein
MVAEISLASSVKVIVLNWNGGGTAGCLSSSEHIN